MPNKTKIIVTNKGALEAKYKDEVSEVYTALNKLVESDSNKNLSTSIIYLDDPFEMEDNWVEHAKDERANKKAIDFVYEKYKPNYLVILGADDIIPFQRLVDPSSPLHDPVNPMSKFLPSDLPYACSNTFSRKFDDFIKPERVVSRIPDVKGKPVLDIIKLTLEHIRNTNTRTANSYKKPWAVCTQKRIVPMTKTLEKMYGYSGVEYNEVPPKDYKWRDEYLELLHFHIVHGAKNCNILIGESNTTPSSRPMAAMSDYIDSNIRRGTIVLERACYGGQLYNPDKGIVSKRLRSYYPLIKFNPHTLPLVNMYLKSGAAAVLGSSVSNYSNQKSMKLGDHLMAEFFLALNNCSIGEAFLKARQRVVKFMKTPGDKTMLAGFSLFGDASVVPMADEIFDIKEYNTVPELKPVKGAIKGALGEPEEIEYLGEVLDERIPPEVKKFIEEFFESEGIEILSPIACYQVMINGEPHPTKLRYAVCVKIDGSESWVVFESPGSTPGEPVSLFDFYTN